MLPAGSFSQVNLSKSSENRGAKRKLLETFSTYGLTSWKGREEKDRHRRYQLRLYEGSAAVVGAGAETFKGGHTASLPRGAGAFIFRWLEEVLVLEELDPVIERELTYLCGKHHLNVTIKGKLTGICQMQGSYR